MKKMTSILKIGGLILFTAALLFLGACDDGEKKVLNPVDKTALKAKITEAETLLATAVASADGTDVLMTKNWVATAIWNALDSAIKSGKQISSNNNATATQVNDAITALNTAMAVFLPQRGTGVPNDGLNRTAFNTLVSEIDAFPSTLIITDDGTFLGGVDWYLISDYNILLTAVDTAIETVMKTVPDIAQSDIDNAVSILNTAKTNFEAKKKNTEIISTPLAYRVNAAGTAFANAGNGSGYTATENGKGSFVTSGGLKVYDTVGKQEGRWKYDWFNGWWDRYIDVGYINLGAQAGKLIAESSDFSIETIFALPADNPDAVVDQVIWSFADTTTVTNDLFSLGWREVYLRIWSETYSGGPAHAPHEIHGALNKDGASWDNTREDAHKPYGKWVHTVVTKSGGTLTMYIDGVQIWTRTITNWPAYTATNFTDNYLGKNPHPGADAAAEAEAFGGDLARTGYYHFAIDNKAWNAAKVDLRYNKGPVGSGVLTTWESSAISKSALNNKILEAEAALVGVAESDDGLDIPQSGKWVTAAQKKTLTDAIDAAKIINNKEDATKDEISNSLTALSTVLDTFLTQIQDGKQATDFTDLEELITTAKTHLAIVVVSADEGATVPMNQVWVTQAEFDALDTVIKAAEAMVAAAAATQVVVDAMIITLDDAMKALPTHKMGHAAATELNKGPLTEAIAEAKTIVAGLQVADNEFDTGKDWVTAAVKTEIETAITGGETALDEATVPEDQESLNDALEALETALGKINKAKYNTKVVYRVNSAGNGFVNIGAGGETYTATVANGTGLFETSGELKVFNTQGTKDGTWMVHGNQAYDRFIDVAWVDLSAAAGDIVIAPEWTVEIIFALPGDFKGNLIDQFVFSFSNPVAALGGNRPHPNDCFMGLNFETMNFNMHRWAMDGGFDSFAQARFQFEGKPDPSPWVPGGTWNVKAHGKWVHLVLVKKADNTVSLYINGDLAYTSPFYDTFNNWNENPNPAVWGTPQYLAGELMVNTFGRNVFQKWEPDTTPIADGAEALGNHLYNAGLYHFAISDSAWTSTDVTTRYGQSPVGEAKALNIWVPTLKNP